MPADRDLHRPGYRGRCQPLGKAHGRGLETGPSALTNSLSDDDLAAIADRFRGTFCPLTGRESKNEIKVQLGAA
jgi:hypothetical protein